MMFLGLAADCDLTLIWNLIYRIQRVQVRVFGFLVCGLTLCYSCMPIWFSWFVVTSCVEWCMVQRAVRVHLFMVELMSMRVHHRCYWFLLCYFMADFATNGLHSNLGCIWQLVGSQNLVIMFIVIITWSLVVFMCFTRMGCEDWFKLLYAGGWVA